MSTGGSVCVSSGKNEILLCVQTAVPFIQQTQYLKERGETAT